MKWIAFLFSCKEETNDNNLKMTKILMYLRILKHFQRLFLTVSNVMSFTFLSTPVLYMHSGLICIALRLSVRPSVQVCESYVVHHLMSTGLCCAPRPVLCTTNLKLGHKILCQCQSHFCMFYMFEMIPRWSKMNSKLCVPLERFIFGF